MRALSLMVFLAGVVSAQPLSGVYQGRVGARPVVLELGRPSAGRTEGRYFYAGIGLDLSLQGRAGGEVLILNERPADLAVVRGPDDPPATGLLTLRSGPTGLSGTWRAPDGGPTRPVRLTRAQTSRVRLALPPSPGLLRLRAEDPYLFLKLNHRLRPAGRHAGLNWWREPLSGLAYPRLPGGPARNAGLQDLQLQAARDALDCRSVHSGASGFGPTSWQQATTVTYHTPDWLSLKVEVDLDCGGVHPDAFTLGHTFDARTGRSLDARSLWPGLGDAALQQRYLQAYRRSAAAHDDPDCLGTIRERGSGDDYSRFLSPRGLTLWPQFAPHADLACAQEVTLPYSSLAALAVARAPRR